MVRQAPSRRESLPHISTLIPELWELLSDNERELLLLYSKLYECKPGTEIYPLPPTTAHRQTDGHVVMVVRGQALTYDRRNDDVPLHFTGPEILGLSEVLSRTDSLYYCKAISNCLILSITADHIQTIIDRNPRVIKLLLTRSLKALSERDTRLIILNTRHMPGRMAATLLYLDREFGRESDGKTLKAKLTRYILGGLSNMTTSNATRVLRSFQDDGIVALKGKEIQILKETALEDVSRHG